MTETIIAALISAGSAIVVCLITSATQHKKIMTELDKKDALQEYRLKQIETKMDKHNNLIERTYELEKKVAILEEDIKK